MLHRKPRREEVVFITMRSGNIYNLQYIRKLDQTNWTVTASSKCILSLFFFPMKVVPLSL